MIASKTLKYLSEPLRRMDVRARVGRVTHVANNVATVSGLSDIASVGHGLSFGAGDSSISGEVIEVRTDELRAMLEGPPDKLRIDDPTFHRGAFRLFPDQSWLGRIIDGNGRPLDRPGLLQGLQPIPIASAPPPATERRGLGARLATGYAVFDTILPIVHGQRIGLFAGSGVGKSSLMAAFARELQADVVVIGLIGERGREVREFVERVLGKKGLARSVVVASTSDTPAIARRRAAFTAMGVAEYFRDQGKHVLLMIDSITRLAESHREIATAAGEMATMRGHPASLVQLMSALTERAGPGTIGQGDITAVFTVLVSGSDMEEPVADTLRGLLDGHFVLSRSIAERGRFPSVDVLQSVSRALPHSASESENAMIQEFRRLVSLYEEAEIMLRAGLHQVGVDSELDRAIELFPRLDAFCAERNASGHQAAFARLADMLSGAAKQDTNSGPAA